MKFNLFKNQNFLLLIIGYSTSLFGTVFLNTALSLYILNLTGSATKYALVLLLGIIPQILLGLFAGVVVDRVDRRKIILFFGYCTWIIFDNAFRLFNIASSRRMDNLTVLPSILEKEELIDGNAMLTTISEASKTLGPVLAAVIYALSGMRVVMLIDGVTFLVSVVTTYHMVFSKPVKTPVRVTLYQDVKIGLASVFTRDIRITSLVMNGVLTHIFLHSFILVGVPYMLIHVFKGTDIQFGTVQTMITAGSICAIMAVVFMKKRFSTSQNIGFGILGMTITVLPYFALGNNHFLQLLSINHIVPVTFFSMVTFAIYFAYNTYAIFFISFYQNIIPSEILGRETDWIQNVDRILLSTVIFLPMLHSHTIMI